MAVDEAILRELRAIAGPGGWSEDPARLGPKLEEWRGRWRGTTPLLLAPDCVETAARLLAACAAHGVAVVPQGGNTGLVGGQIPQGEVLLSSERLTRIRRVDPDDDVIVAEAGATLAAVRAAAADAGRAFPLSLASEGSCTVGGLIATNAGGVQVLRYGTMRALTLGVEAALPDGRIHRGLKRLRKDATGFDLAQALVGAEGTLGFVTAASLRLAPALPDRAAALAATPSVAAAVELLAVARRATGGALEAFELMGRLGLELAVRKIPGARDPLGAVFEHYVLLEAAGPAGGDVGAGLEAALAEGLTAGLVLDATLAASEAQRLALWALREGQSAAQKGEGTVWKHDVATPISRVAEFVERAGAIARDLAPGARVVAFGHIGDGNIHFDVLGPEGGDDARHADLRATAEAAIGALAVELEGTISAEHGLGVMKSRAALAYKSEAEVFAYRALRRALDPAGVMNPRVLF